MEAGFRASKSKLGTSPTAEASVPSPDKKGKVSQHEDRRKTGSAVSGLVVYLGLVLFAYCLGMMIPNTSKSKPVPAGIRTYCKQKPEVFDPAEAKGKKVLITGAAGFMGSYLSRHCAEDLGMDVVGLDDYSSGTTNIPFLSDIRIVKGDLSNSTFLAALFAKHQFDIVYHTSQVGGSSLSHHHPSKIYETNLMGTVNLVSQVVSAKTPRFVLLSSAGVYGSAEGPWAETTVPKPSDPAGISRLAAEQHLRSAGLYFGVDYIILRLHSIYGPHMEFTAARSNIVARTIQAAASGTPLTIHGVGTQKRQFTYVGDVAELIAQAAFLKQREFHVINIGSDEINSVSELVTEVEAVSGHTLDVSRGGESTGTYHVQVVHDRSRCIFGAERFTPLKQGLQATYTWASGTDLPARLQSHQEFQAEILEPGRGGLAAMEHGAVVNAQVARALQDLETLLQGEAGVDRHQLR